MTTAATYAAVPSVASHRSALATGTSIAACSAGLP